MLVRILAGILICSLIMGSCKSKKKSVSYKNKPRTERVKASEAPAPAVVIAETPPVVEAPKTYSTYDEVIRGYIEDYSTIAKEEMLQYGIPASITLAQGILESGAGRGELTGKANNHFGIKCHKEWTGERVYHDDDTAQECFRKYSDPKYSFRDHSLFLTSRSRYQELFKLKKDDYKGWAKGLKKAGYATDPKYPDKLISLIERYNLEVYDDQVLGNQANLAHPDTSKISTYSVKKGDTLYSISRMYNITVDTLKEYNGLRSNDIAIGQILYLHPNKN
jgi:flagellum-specific peptidoglycan hydrolase FlgJ